MALLKSISTDFGVPADYWRILGMQIYYADAQVDVTLVGYASAAARLGEKSPMASVGPVRLTWADMDLESEGEPSRALAYEAIKALAQDGDGPLAVLSGAEDV